jgi:hypothetical protein
MGRRDDVDDEKKEEEEKEKEKEKEKEGLCLRLPRSERTLVARPGCLALKWRIAASTSLRRYHGED